MFKYLKFSFVRVRLVSPPGSWEEPAVADVRPAARGLRAVRRRPLRGAGAAAGPGQAAANQTRDHFRWWANEMLEYLKMGLPNNSNQCLICFLTFRMSSSAAPDKDAQLKSHYDQLLMGAQKDLESQKDQVTRTQQELSVQRQQVKAVGFSFPGLILSKNQLSN